MRLNEIIAWYQKKISSNDKQQWEHTVEQRILHGCSQTFPLKTAKLTTGLIDVDLVRGSTFPKAKPKQTLITVLYLAVVRLIFLPVYAKWWAQQTSNRVFALLLTLYGLQMMSVYSYNVHRSTAVMERTVHISEILIPMALSLCLSVIHSQIAATSDGGLNKKRSKRRSPTKSKKREKFKRRRPKVRTRSSVVASKSNIVEQEAPAEISAKSRLNVDIPLAMPGVSRRSEPVLVVAGPPSNLRKRTVAWDSPIRSVNREVVPEPARVEVVEPPVEAAAPVGIEDDGFESFNGKSSSGEDNNNVVVNQVPEVREPVIVAGQAMTSNSDTDTVMADSPFFVSNSKKPNRESTDTDGESDEGGTLSSPGINSSPPFVEATTSATEWIGITTNSEECSYSSEIDRSDDDNDLESNSEDGAHILNASCGSNDRISCTIWDGREIKKAEMSIMDISSLIIDRVESMPESCDYIYIGAILSVLLSMLPAFCRLRQSIFEASNSTDIDLFDMPSILLERAAFSEMAILELAFGNQTWERTVSIISFFQRLILTFLFFFLLTVAEKTFKQRFLYAKLFSHLTSSRRARKSNIPHFRLNKVRNIKTWLSVRSYLKRRGPQRSVDMIVSAAFMITLLLVAFLSVEWLSKESVHIHTQLNLEALMWSVALGVFLLRFMTLGQKINKKYRSVSVLITEQINLYVQIEQKPHKKEELMVANSVLKLAADLLKELESPFKVSGLSANPYLYTTIKVVILSALSGVLSEMLGFKLKLHKIKIK